MAKEMNGRIGIILWVLGVIVAVQGWTVMQIFTFNTRVAMMETKEFSSDDGLEIWREIALIRADMK